MLDKNKSWTPAVKTDIRRTWVMNWPVSTQDEVFKRIMAQVEAGENKPDVQILELKKR